MACTTQWRAGYGGATGLDYTAVEAVMRLLDIKPQHMRALFADLRLMEAEALRAWAEKSR